MVLFCLLTWDCIFLHQVEVGINGFIQLKPQSNGNYFGGILYFILESVSSQFSDFFFSCLKLSPT